MGPPFRAEPTTATANATGDMWSVPPPTPGTAVSKVQPKTAPALKTDNPQADNPVQATGQSQSKNEVSLRWLHEADGSFHHQFVTGDLFGRVMANSDIFIFCFFYCIQMLGTLEQWLMFLSSILFNFCFLSEREMIKLSWLVHFTSVFVFRHGHHGNRFTDHAFRFWCVPCSLEKMFS